MNININLSGIENAKTMPDLQKELSRLLQQLETNLRQEPNFLLLLSEGQDIPKSTQPNTIIFKFDETLNVITGYYDGENIHIA